MVSASLSGSNMEFNSHSYQGASPSTCNQIWAHKPCLEWIHIVWFSQGIPRYSFITWLAIKDNQREQDRILGGASRFVHYVAREMKLGTIFFTCPYTYIVWLELSINPHIDRILSIALYSEISTLSTTSWSESWFKPPYTTCGARGMVGGTTVTITHRHITSTI